MKIEQVLYLYLIDKSTGFLSSLWDDNSLWFQILCILSFLFEMNVCRTWCIENVFSVIESELQSKKNIYKRTINRCYLSLICIPCSIIQWKDWNIYLGRQYQRLEIHLFWIFLFITLTNNKKLWQTLSKFVSFYFSVQMKLCEMFLN